VRGDLDDDVDLIGSVVAGGDLVEVHKGASLRMGALMVPLFARTAKSTRETYTSQAGV
jgi:hypothetical protein